MPTLSWRAQKIATALELEWREGLVWAGRVDGLKARVEGDALNAELARVVISLPRSLRLGCLAYTGPSLAELGDTPAIPFGYRRLDTFLVLGAAEPEVARAILRTCADDIIALEGSWLRIDDRTISLTEKAIYSHALLAQQAPKMAALARRLVAERDEWEARFETAIEPLWSRLAAEAEMQWDADRSRITGEPCGARFDLQVTSDVGSLSARVRSRWPSLGRGLALEWAKTKPTDAPERKRPRDWPSDAPMSYEATHATELIASAGAAFSLDDEGAVARLPDLDDVYVERTFRAMLTLTRELIVPTSMSAGVYR